MGSSQYRFLTLIKSKNSLMIEYLDMGAFLKTVSYMILYQNFSSLWKSNKKLYAALFFDPKNLSLES